MPFPIQSAFYSGKIHLARVFRLLSSLLLKKGEYYVRELKSTEQAASSYTHNSNKIEKAYNS